MLGCFDGDVVVGGRLGLAVRNLLSPLAGGLFKEQGCLALRRLLTVVLEVNEVVCDILVVSRILLRLLIVSAAADNLVR